MVYAIGGLLVLEDIATKNQKYLKLHDNEITALSVSPRGNISSFYALNRINESYYG